MNNEAATRQGGRGRLLVAAAALLWSTSGVFVKNLDLPGGSIAMGRSLAAGVALAFVARLSGARVSFRPAMILMALAFMAMNYTFITSMTLTTAANTIFLQYTAPVWMALIGALWLREPVDRASALALVGAMIGIGVLIAGQGSFAEGDAMGIVLGLASGFFFALVTVCLRYLRSEDPLWLATVNHLAAGVILLTLGLGGALDLRLPSSGQWTTLALFGVCQMATPYVLYGMGLRTISPAEAGLLSMLEPVLNPIWTRLFAGEKPGSATVVGGAILLASITARYLPLDRSASKSPRS